MNDTNDKTTCFFKEMVLSNRVKLILNHQESRSLPNVDMVKFRALLGEASLQKKGTCSVSLRVPSQLREIGTTQMTPISKKSSSRSCRYI
jgi:hypothetical protein